MPRRVYQPLAHAYGLDKPNKARAYDLLDLDYTGASQVTWYVGDDGMVHACANNVLRSSADLTDTTGWSVASGSTVVTRNTIDFQSNDQGVFQNLPGTSNRFLGKVGETLSLSLEVEVLELDVAGNLSLRYANNSGSEVTARSNYQLTAVGQRVQMFMTFTPSGTPTPRIWIQNRSDVGTAFQGKVRVRGLCLSIGVKTFPYIKTGTSGAVYKFRNGRFLRGWNGSAWVSTKAVELNSGEGGMRGLFEGVAATNLVTGHRGSNWTPTRATWAISSGVTDPSGANNAGRITEDTTASNTHELTFNLTLADNTTHTVGGCFKSSTREVRLVLRTKDAVTVFVSVNLSTGAVVSSSGASGVVVRSLANGWYFVSFNRNIGAGATAPFVRIQLINGVASYTGDGASNIDFWGVSVVAASYATQPILTYGSTVTRAAEAPTSTALAGKSKTGSMTLEVVGVTAPGSGATSGELASIEHSSDRFSIADSDSDGDGDSLMRPGILASGVGVVTTSFQTLTRNRKAACVASYSVPNAILVNGTTEGVVNQQGSVSVVTAPSTSLGSTLYLANRSAGGTSPHRIAAFRHLRFIADAALSQAACLARAITLYNQ